jgi:ribosomal protein S18 acetylase RimI-like enzyme
MSDGPAAVTVRIASRDEAAALAAVIREAFISEAEVYGDIPPMHEAAADIEETFDAGDVTLAAEADGRLAGTVRGETMPDGEVAVRRLAVLPWARRRGIARALLVALEDAYPHVARMELFTGSLNGAALRLYESLGYVRTGTREIAPGVELVTLEKRMVPRDTD